MMKMDMAVPPFVFRKKRGWQKIFRARDVRGIFARKKKEKRGKMKLSKRTGMQQKEVAI